MLEYFLLEFYFLASFRKSLKFFESLLFFVSTRNYFLANQIYSIINLINLMIQYRDFIFYNLYNMYDLDLNVHVYQCTVCTFENYGQGILIQFN